MNISEEHGLTESRLAIPWNPTEVQICPSVHQPPVSEGVPATSNIPSRPYSSSSAIPVQVNQSEIPAHPAVQEASNQSSCVQARDFQSSSIDGDIGSDISASSTLFSILSSTKGRTIEQNDQNVHPEPEFKFPAKNASSVSKQKKSTKLSTPLKELCKVAVSYTQRESSLKKTSKEIFHQYFSTTPLASASGHSEESMAKSDKSILTTDEVIDSSKRIIVNNSGVTGQPCLATPAGEEKPESPEWTIKVAQPPEGKNAISIGSTQHSTPAESISLLSISPLDDAGGNSLATTSTLDGALELPPKLSSTVELLSNPESIQDEFTKRHKSVMIYPIIQLDRSPSAGETMELGQDPPLEISEVKFSKKNHVSIHGNDGSSKQVKKNPKGRRKSRSHRGELLAENSSRPTANHRASKRKLVDASDSDFPACQPKKKRGKCVLRPCSVVLRQIFRVHLPEGTFEISR